MVLVSARLSSTSTRLILAPGSFSRVAVKRSPRQAVEELRVVEPKEHNVSGDEGPQECVPLRVESFSASCCREAKG